MEETAFETDDRLRSIILRLASTIDEIAKNFGKLRSAVSLDELPDEKYIYACNVLIGLDASRELLDDACIVRRAELVVKKEREKEERENVDENVGMRKEMDIMRGRITKLERFHVPYIQRLCEHNSGR